MFAMLLGPWPRVTGDGTRLDALEAGVAAGSSPADALARAIDGLVAEVVEAQVGAGLGLVTDGLVRWPDPAAAVLAALRTGDTGPDGCLVRSWRDTAARTEATVAQVVPGPWTLATLEGGGAGSDGIGGTGERAASIADGLAAELEALAAAGCPLVEVLEPAAVGVAADEQAWDPFLAAHRRLLARVGAMHSMLAVTGGSAARDAAAALLGAPYASFLFDLVAGPDNWHLVRALPGHRGVICAALEAGKGAERRDQAPELLWAARYAASANDRGMARVGLANGTPLGDLSPEEARTAVRALGRAAALAAMPVERAVEAGLDPRVLPRRPPPRGGRPGAKG